MTERMWQLIATGIKSLVDAPAWVHDLSFLSFEEVLKLPILSYDSVQRVSQPSAEESVVAADYLDFLREQIRLAPRGPQWNRVLKDRLTALEPFVGKRVLTGGLFRLPDSATIRIDPETGNVFHFEVL